MPTDDHAQVPPEKQPCNEPDAFAEATCRSGRSGRQHLAHAGPPWGPRNDHQHVARLDTVGEDSLPSRRLGVEHTRRSGDRRILQAVILATQPSGEKIAFQDRRFPGRRSAWKTAGSTSWSPAARRMSASICAIVLPVIVMQSPCRGRSQAGSSAHCGMPPPLCRSVATYCAEVSSRTARHLAANAFEVRRWSRQCLQSARSQVMQNRVGTAPTP